jgi:hypothetical protein
MVKNSRIADGEGNVAFLTRHHEAGSIVEWPVVEEELKAGACVFHVKHSVQVKFDFMEGWLRSPHEHPSDQAVDEIGKVYAMPVRATVSR